MMFDVAKGFYLMFIRRGLERDQLWTKERIQLEKKFLEDQTKKPIPETLDYKTELGVFRCKYDKSQSI